MTFTRLHISVLLTLTVLAWALVLVVEGTPVSREHLTPFGTVVGLLVMLGLAFERVLWHQPYLHWFFHRPDLRGTWRVELQSDWVNPGTREPTPLIVCYMGVSQTLSTLQMHLMTPESGSWFIADRIRASPNGLGYQIVGVYTNKPQMNLRGVRSEIHQGALILDSHGPNARPETLTGEYWTDRKTTGRMTFTRRIPTVITRFHIADLAFRQ